MPNLSISPKKIVWVLAFIVVGLTMAHVVGQYYKNFIGDDASLLKVIAKLDLDGESNKLPNWYQSSTLLLSAFLLAIIALTRKAEQAADTRYWVFLAITFVYLSADELVSIHEQATVPLRHAFDLGGFFYLSWVIPGAVIVSLFLILHLRFLWRLPPETRWRLILAGAVYVSGAIGTEMIGARFFQLHESDLMHAPVAGAVAFQYSLMTATEELLEMTGIVLFIYGLMSYIVSESLPVSAKESIPSQKNALPLMGSTHPLNARTSAFPSGGTVTMARAGGISRRTSVLSIRPL